MSTAPMHEHGNLNRRHRRAAYLALQAYSSRDLGYTDHSPGVDIWTENAPDLLADLMHLAKNIGADFDEALETARRNYAAEGAL